MLLSPFLLNVLGVSMLFLTFQKAFVYSLTNILGNFIEMEKQIVFQNTERIGCTNCFKHVFLFSCMQSITVTVIIHFCTSRVPKQLCKRLYYCFFSYLQPIVFLTGKSYNNQTYSSGSCGIDVCLLCITARIPNM